MSNQFKKGDKVVRKEKWRDVLWGFGDKVCTVVYTDGRGRIYFGGSSGWLADRFRAAIAGQDYPAPAREPVFPAKRANGDADPGYPCAPPVPQIPTVSASIAHYAGHLPDGSSVQKHSAGPLYPCVIVLRDGTLGGKYDYGVISPRNQEPLWFSNPEAAMSVADTIKKDLT